MKRRLSTVLLLVVLSAWAPACKPDPTPAAAKSEPPPLIPAPDYGQFDANRVERFLARIKKVSEKRIEELDKRIGDAALSLADKIESLKRLAPPAESTGKRDEVRLERLLLSVPPAELALFKFALEYDGDYKDLEEYIFHDIDNAARRLRILEHLRLAPAQPGIKVLTDVDDTMYANLIERRYPKKTVYPGVLEFYDSLRSESFEASPIAITTLSARPNPINGILEQGSLRSLVSFTNGRLRPSALSGKLRSSIFGSLQTVLRANEDHLDLLCDDSHGQEDKIGEVKFKNFSNFKEVYPDYRFVFVGDSGQADALTARLMIKADSGDVPRVLTTFIHDIRQSEDDRQSASASFSGLLQDAGLLVTETSSSGRGVIIFRNYIQAASIAYAHSATLGDLVTAKELAAITKAALEQLREIVGKTGHEGFGRLKAEYRQDAERAYELLMKASGQKDYDVADLRRILDEGL